MSMHKKIANENYEYAGKLTSRRISRHGLSTCARYYKRYYNRIGKRGEARRAFRDAEVKVDHDTW